MKRRTITAGLAGMAAWMASPALRAQPKAWPDKAVRIIVPFGAGSGNDLVARMLSERLTHVLGQPFVVDNKAGANGSIGASAVARSAPDGYTLFVTTNTTQAANPSLMKNLSYDPVADFAPISRIANTPALLVVNPSLPVHTLAELMALAKARPGQLTYASGSAGTIVPAAMLTSGAGIQMLHVPYKTIPLALNDVIAGQVQMMFTDMATGLPQVRAGKVRPIAISSLQPSPQLPEVPPIARTLPGFELLAWYALYAPAGTPAAIIDRLNKETKAFVADPGVRDRLLSLGLEAVSSSPAELADFGRAELAKWTRLIKAAGIEPE